MRVLLVDNYDSFTYNLEYYLKELGAKVCVVKNDFAPIAEAIAFVESFDCLMISPGFGTPLDSGLSLELIQTFASWKNILGVCLGHQCIAQAFGGKVERMEKPMHAKNALCYFVPNALTKGIRNPFKIALYHSLYVSELGDCEMLGYSVVGEKKIPMVLKHKRYNTYGVQFHPESILQENGKKLLKNFLKLKAQKV
ncbi:aminodeoxychorismate/anthranilate synthase component II [Helicobacter sp.]|uniref:aminodeoxychorismate/anthranilate synthase component II n=1 Tax=Helicobacter sp. TaxID=218 RepID=UPI0025B893B4|nr:aminodeoxychorismate/anthranilate synthase component II [Helicobacter sp.]MCI5968881.1 aminodeoxychorismate/anthranilate synthase component II [Helicobacter sp.]MDY2584983.1 aminodeoxychorismate/anthranilate synthase component II [Helicobacter sp.]